MIPLQSIEQLQTALIKIDCAVRQWQPQFATVWRLLASEIQLRADTDKLFVYAREGQMGRSFWFSIDGVEYYIAFNHDRQNDRNNPRIRITKRKGHVVCEFSKDATLPEIQDKLDTLWRSRAAD